MEENKNVINEMNADQFFDSLIDYLYELKQNQSISQKIVRAIYCKDGVDYPTLTSLIPKMDEDDVALILKYDMDYKISFLLSLTDLAEEEDMTRQALFLLKKHNLSYIIPLLPFVDEDKIKEEYSKLI